MICSICGRSMVEAGLDFPNFRRRKHADEGRILSQSLRLIRGRTKQLADFLNGARKDFLPLGITSEQGSGGGILTRPSGQIGTGNFPQFRVVAQTFRHPAGHFQACLIDFGVIHASTGSLPPWSYKSRVPATRFYAGAEAGKSFFRDANTGAGQDFTGLAAAVQLRLRVALGLQTLTVKSRLLTGENTVQVRGDPPISTLP
jgi:hypothetical protein